MDPRALLRSGLLDGRTIALGGEAPFAPSLTALGAVVAPLAPTLDETEATARAAAAIAAQGPLDVLVHDLRPAFAGGGHDGLRTALDECWVTLRAVANAAWIEPRRDGRVVLIAPPPGDAAAAAADAGAPAPAGRLAAVPPPEPHGADDAAARLAAPPLPDPHADGVRGAAENIARTLSIEWARYGIRAVAITPGALTTDDELAALAAYLASPAGDYFSGARLSLGEAGELAGPVAGPVDSAAVGVADTPSAG